MAWLERLRSGLKKTRAGLADSLAQVFSGRTSLEAADLEALEDALVSADVGVQLAGALVSDLAAAMRRDPRDPRAILRDLMAGRLQGAEGVLPLREDGTPTVILVAGVNGAGKTTTIAKMAAHLRAARPDLPITFAAADTFRAAAAEQLAVWADRIGAHLVRQQSGADPAAVVYDALDHALRTGGVLFVDTAGRLQTKHNLMEELRKIERTVLRKLAREADERLLVLDATTGQNAIVQAERFHEAIRLTGLVLTKLDSTAKGGVVLAIRETLALPILFVGVGEAADDLQPFSAREFVEALFPDDGA
ncbi:MAG: signal recognition particle-docking protein FtsY [Candidatus Bipolaricaulota bacterium]